MSVPEGQELFDAQTAKRLRELASTLAMQLLAQPTKIVPAVVRFPKGTTQFRHLYILPPAPYLIALLDTVVQELSRDTGAGVYRIAKCDPTIAPSSAGHVTIMMYPQDMDVTRLNEVPGTVRIFNLNTREPFDVWLIVPYDSRRIAAERLNIATADAHKAWCEQLEQLIGRLSAIAASERDQLGSTLPDSVMQKIDSLLKDAHAEGHHHALYVLHQALSYMGALHKAQEAYKPFAP